MQDQEYRMEVPCQHVFQCQVFLGDYFAGMSVHYVLGSNSISLKVSEGKIFYRSHEIAGNHQQFFNL